MAIRDSVRWQIAAVAAAVAVVLFNPYLFQANTWLFGSHGEWYSQANQPTPTGFILHVCVYFFIMYLFLMLDWQCSLIL